MTELLRSTIVEASVDRVWAVVRDFNALPVWMDGVADSRIEGGGPSDRVGCVRNFRLRASSGERGGTIRERLLALDDRAHACTYEILESDMAVTDYVATLALLPVTDTNATYVEWTAEFGCKTADERALVTQIGDGVFAEGLDALRRRFAR